MEKLSQKDLEYLCEKTFTQEDTNWQLTVLEKGTNFLKIDAPATIGNGIIKMTDKDKDFMDATIQNIEVLFPEIDSIKFVPASGAASRMFSRLIKYNNDPTDKNFTDGDFYSVQNTINNIDKFAFADKIKDRTSPKKIVEQILYEPLNYFDIPKALVEFHKINNQPVTAFEEQLKEAILLNIKKIHFTISEKHQDLFTNKWNEIKHLYSQINVEFSFQALNTDTISIYEDGKIVRDENNNIVLRPGGHGSLINNLNKFDESFVYISNIDNITPNYSAIVALNRKKMYCELVSLMAQLKAKKELSQPIRVCAMVKNTGEPGGGPFVIGSNENKYQIVEKSQINLNDPKQKQIFDSSTHFNPVDLLCFIPNNCNLEDFIDKQTAFVANKTYNGRNIKVLERPGLWNGAMSKWTTIFVEIPNECFNPVKELNDLLKPEHQPK